MLRHTTLCAFVVFIMVMGAAYAQGRNGVCSGLSGNAFGLCNAYCEAKSCDSFENYGSPSCTQLRSNFERLPGSPKMPCEGDSAQIAPPSTGSCPCNFSLPFWTDPDRVDAIVQILPSDHLNFCIEKDPNTCLTCSVNYMTSPFTLLSVLVNRFVPGQFAEEDKLLFFARQPFLEVAGACGVGTTFASGFSYTTEGFELPVRNSEDFAACALDIGALAYAFDNMCMR